MWLRFGGLEGVSGAPQRRILPDDFSVSQASVHRCTTDGNRVVFPFFVLLPRLLADVHPAIQQAPGFIPLV